VAINYFNRIEPAQKVQRACEEFGVRAIVVKAVSLVHESGVRRDAKMCC
jgi:hypothetical protein